MSLSATHLAGVDYLFDAAGVASHELAAVFNAPSPVTTQAFAGRGAVRLLTWNHRTYVHRHSYRGGLMRGWGDRYLWTGLQSTRVWREAQLLTTLHDDGLPVPSVLVARVVKCGLIYRADLITEYLADTQSLAARLRLAALSPELWQALGRLLLDLHRRGIFHADLNAHNVLLSGDDRVSLIDFDRAKTRATAAHYLTRMQQRLWRSLCKLQAEGELHFSAADWQRLLAVGV